jgi:hypothetical protein
MLRQWRFCGDFTYHSALTPQEDRMPQTDRAARAFTRFAGSTAALVFLGVVAACQATPAGSPTQQVTTAPTTATTASASASATASQSQASSEACNTAPQDPKIWAVVRNNDQAQFLLTVVGRDGACNWPVKPGATGGVTVPAPSGNGKILVFQATDCKVIGDFDVPAGIHEITIQSGVATERVIQDTDALGLGEAPVGPCTPTG